MIMSDNCKHTTICAGIAAVVMAVGKVASCSMEGSCIAANIIAMTAGFVKEWCDNFDFEGERNRWSWSDIKFDAIGTAIGAALGALMWLA